MNAIACRGSVVRAVGAVLLLVGLATVAAAQSPYFPNTQPTYYSPYGQGAYGRYGSTPPLPPAFRTTPPAFMRPNSAIPYNYRSSSSGFYYSPYIQNNAGGGGAMFHPLGY